jgi:long-subunit acyl-CoA synthetase (AMP-forming)
MDASDKNGLSRGYGAVLWTAWTDAARTVIVFYSERARREHLAHAELAEQVARVARGLRELDVGRFCGIPRGS